jgi:hypothetical protein
MSCTGKTDNSTEKSNYAIHSQLPYSAKHLISSASRPLQMKYKRAFTG